MGCVSCKNAVSAVVVNEASHMPIRANSRATDSPAVRPQASEMVPRRADYGSVGLDTGVVESGLDAENHTGDRNPFVSREAMSGSVPEAQRGGPQGAWKWWCVGIVAAAVVTTYSTATGVVRFSTFRGQLTKPSSKGGDSAAFKVELEDNPTLPHQQNTAQLAGNPRVQSSSELAFTASNAYTRCGDKIGLGYPWLEGRILVEPYRDTMLEVISPAENMAHSWIILEDDGEAGKTTVGEYIGSEVVVVFGQKSQYTIVQHEYSVSSDSDGLVLSRSVETEVMCKYVLREIRSLFDNERNEMFDAMKVSAQQSSLYIKGAVYTV